MRIQTTMTGISELVIQKRISNLGLTNVNAYVRWLITRDVVSYLEVQDKKNKKKRHLKSP